MIAEWMAVRIWSDDYAFVIRTNRVTLNHTLIATGDRCQCMRAAIAYNRKRRAAVSGEVEILRSYAKRDRRRNEQTFDYGLFHTLQRHTFHDISHVYRAADRVAGAPP